MGPRPVVCLLLLAALAAPALGQDAPRGGVQVDLAYTRPVGAFGGSIPLRSRGVFRVEGERLEFSCRLLGSFAGSATPDASGAWRLGRVEAQRDGMAGRLEDEQRSPDSGVWLELRRSDAGYVGRVTHDGKLTSRVWLRQAPRLLTVYTSVRVWHEAPQILYRVLQVENEYRKRGYSITRLKTDTYAQLSEVLEAAGDQHDPFDRIVIVSHAGARDGPVFGFGDVFAGDGGEASQASPSYNTGDWRAFVRAIQVGTTPDVRIYAGGCHTGGWNATEVRNGRGAERSWAEELARATQRTVVGPAGLTSWWRSLAAVRAMEGDGPAPQETRWANADGAVTLLEGETRDEGFQTVPSVTSLTPETGAPGETISITVTHFANVGDGRPGNLPAVTLFGSTPQVPSLDPAGSGSLVLTVQVPTSATPGPLGLTIRVGSESLTVPFTVR